MCGLAGFLDYRGVDGEAGLRVLSALGALNHRGEDGSGVLVAPPTILGHRRLALHDPTELGLQPITDARSTWSVAINGTIHNHRELRAQPFMRDYPFKGNSDSEVLLPLLLSKGIEGFVELEGPFSLAAWHHASETLYLARDHPGQKPLYYVRDDNKRCAVASEIAALLKITGRRPPAKESVATFLRLGWLPPHQNFLEGVRRVPAGAVLAIDKTGERRLDIALRRPSHSDKRTFIGHLTHALRRRMQSDRPTGLFLSGGLDSSTIACLSTSIPGPPLPTFSLRFEDPRFDQSELAADVARHLGLPHRQIPYEGDAVQTLERVIRRTGEPLGDSSLLALEHLCERAREHIVIALTGDGGDELLVGYERHRLARMAQLAPRPLRACAARVSPLLPSARLARGARALALDPTHAHVDLLGLIPESTWGDLAVAEHKDALRTLLPREPDESSSEHEGITAAHRDLLNYLPQDLCRKSDMASMVHGMEIWTPMLDGEVMAAAASLGPEQLLSGPLGKMPLRNYLLDRVPQRVLKERKRGFSFPLEQNLLSGPLRPHAQDLMSQPHGILEGVLKDPCPKGIWDRFLGGERILAPQIFALISLLMANEIWSEDHVRTSRS